MTTYYITIFLVIVFCSLAEYYDFKTAELDVMKQNKHKQMTLLFFFLAGAVLIFVAGFRYCVGADYVNYYTSNAYKASVFIEKLIKLNEPGYFFIAWFSEFINGGGACAIFLSAAITIFLFLRTIYKNTNCLLTATLLFIFIGCWHGTFNGIRQYLAAAILFAGIRFIKERKFWKYALVVFIAFLFHASAIVMIFAYVVAHNKINLKNIIILIVGSLIILASFNEILDFAGFILDQEFQDSWLVGETYITRSINIIRIFIAAAPAVFFIILYQNKAVTNEQKFWLNMLILNAITWFATSNSAYLARMGIYTGPFLAIGIPELIKGVNIKEKKLLSAIIVVAFALFWWYEVSDSYTLNNFQFVFGK